MPFQFYDGTICSAISIAVGHAKLEFDAIFTAIVKTIFKTIFTAESITVRHAKFTAICKTIFAAIFTAIFTAIGTTKYEFTATPPTA